MNPVEASSDGGESGTTGSESSSGDSSNLPSSETEPSTGTSTGDFGAASVRAVHAAPSVGPVDVYVEGEPEPVFESLEFGRATDTVEVFEETIVFEFRPAGALATDPPVHVSAPLSLEDGDRITAVASGILGADDAQSFRVVSVAEDWGPQLAQSARGRVVHVGADAPTFRLDGPSEGRLERFDTTPAAGFALDPEGGERIELLENVPSDPEQLTSFTLPPVAEGDEVLLIATGLLGSLAREPDGFSVIAVGREGVLGMIRQDPQLFVVHGSRDAGRLETCSGDVEVAANLQYGDIQSTRVAPGDYELDIYDYPAGCVGEPLSPGPNTIDGLEAGERYLLLVTGEVTPVAGEAGIQVATFEDAFGLDDGDRARVRFVHGASYSQVFVGALDGLSVPEPNVLTAPIGWSVESAEVPVPAGSYVLGIVDAETTPSFPAFPLVTLPFQAVGGARLWAVVAGDPTPEEGDGFLQVMVIDSTTRQWTVSLADVELPQ